MEVGQRQELEMTEAAPKVYDILHPTPVSLKELSAMVICLELWHRKVNEYRTSGQLSQLKEFKVHELKKEPHQTYSVNIRTWIKSALPDLPSTIYETIEKFLTKFVDSFKAWQLKHHIRVLSGCYSHENYILQDFNDFACDYDGSIDYVRTAERMMRCEGFSTEIKFTIACTYFLEDEIKRIWPSVSSHLSVEFIDFCKLPHFYYWICNLRNEMEKIPLRMNDIDEIMFSKSMPRNRLSMEYFWNRIPLEKQMMQRTANLHSTDFVRFILPKLDERQLDQLVNSGSGFYMMFLDRHFVEVIILRTWSYIKNIMKEGTFAKLVVSLIEIAEREKRKKPIDREKWEYLCSEIWNDTQLNLKQSAIRLISSESDWSEDMYSLLEDYRSDQIHVEFLLLILQDASSKERASFWLNCWNTLIQAVRTKDLQRVIKLCFENEDEITQFKQNFMINSPVVRQVCVSLLNRIEYFFDELNAFVSFCCPELQAARNFKEQILQSVCFNHFQLSSLIVRRKIENFGKFIKDVSADFKNRLMSSPLLMERLSSIICDKPNWDEEISLKTVTEFGDALVSTEETLLQFKMSLIDSLKVYVTTSLRRKRDDLFSKNEFNSILLWCLESSESVEEFKINLSS